MTTLTFSKLASPVVRLALVVTIGLSAAPVASAQDAVPATYGRVTGRVIDAATGLGIVGVGVQVVGVDSMTVQSGIDGRYNLPRVPTGPLTIQVRRMGFMPKTVTGMYLHAKEALEQDISMDGFVPQLQAVAVEGAKEKGTVSAALDAQRNSVGVTNSVTAEQIARSPDGDAAQAVKRISGATVQDGRYVFVRGLGERYTISSLNGSRVPSPEPERRVVPLDMFPAGLIQSITTSKTFMPDLPGDFSGALVDIRTKEFPARRGGSVQLGSGFSAGATGSNLLAATSSGGESFAMVNGGRNLPRDIRALGNFQGVNLSQAQINSLVGSFRNSWTPQPSVGAPLVNGSASFGGTDPILFGHRVGYLFSATLSSGTDAKADQVRALADRGSTRGSTVEMDRFEGQSSSQGVLWGGLTNLSTMIGDRSRVLFNGLYNRSADNDSRVERGEFTGDATRVQITRMQYVQRGLYSAQLAGEHQLTDAQRIDWSATSSGVRRFEPDRSAFVQVIDRDSAGGPEVLRWLSGGSGGAVRTFSDLTEQSRELAASYRSDLGRNGRASLKVGGLYRTTSRDAESYSYAISANGATNDIRELSPEQIFDGRFSSTDSHVFTLGPLSQGGSYQARDQLAAAYAMANVTFGSGFNLTGGARYERDILHVDAVSTLGSPVSSKKHWNDLLPVLAVTWQASHKQQVRVSASRTLARPEYRELTPITSRDVINGENVRGDENLERTNVTNADVRWELYPTSRELVSVAFFAKRFENPIERVYGSGSGGTSFVFFTNAQRADNYGMELELRKELGKLSHTLEPFTAFSNITMMRSTIRLYENTQASATNLSRRMVGQAPYVVNAGLTYTSVNGNTTATMLFNRVGPRITAAGGSPLPDVIESPRNVLDVSLRIGITRAVSARVDAKNLLDTPYEVLQGTVTREFYHSGRAIQAGFLWRP